MQRVRALIEKVAPTESTVLVVGETGTGKELAARAVHDQSDRSEYPRNKAGSTQQCGYLYQYQLYVDGVRKYRRTC